MNSCDLTFVQIRGETGLERQEKNEKRVFGVESRRLRFSESGLRVAWLCLAILGLLGLMMQTEGWMGWMETGYETRMHVVGLRKEGGRRNGMRYGEIR